MARRKKAPRRPPLPPRPPVAAPLPPETSPPSGDPSSTSAAGTTKKPDELGQLEAQLKREEFEDHPAPAAAPGVQVEVHEAPAPGGTPTAKPEMDPADMARNVAVALFAIAALRWGPHWDLSKPEGEMLGQAFAPLARRALEHVSGLGVELTIAAATLFTVVKPRIQKDQELAEQRAQQSPPAEPAP